MGKSFFRLFVALHVFWYRLTGGKVGGQVQGLPILLLTTTGAKSGKQYTIPLGYFEADGQPVIIGSNGGRDTHPAWFFNLKRHPQAGIQIRDKQSEVSAQIVGPEKRDQLWARLVEISRAYGNYAKKTSRVIPLVELLPVRSQT
jgi:deazaflavin-dependent oxidoreductase (nitroreductase family)